MTHKYINKLTIIGSDNGLSPDRRQAIIWTNAGILLIGPLGTNFSEIFIGIHKFSFKKMHLKMSSGKCRPFCPGLNVLTLVRSLFLDMKKSIRADSRVAPSQWETLLLCNAISHWLGANLESGLSIFIFCHFFTLSRCRWLGWNYVSMPKLQRLHRWSLGMDN